MEIQIRFPKTIFVKTSLKPMTNLTEEKISRTMKTMVAVVVTMTKSLWMMVKRPTLMTVFWMLCLKTCLALVRPDLHPVGSLQYPGHHSAQRGQ